MPRNDNTQNGKPNALDFYAVYSVLIEDMRNGNISPREVLLATMIHHLDHSREFDDGSIKGRRCFASNGYLSSMLGVNDRMIRTSISRLKELNYIEIEIIKSAKGNARLIKSNLLRIQNNFSESNEVSRGAKKCPPTTLAKKCQGNISNKDNIYTPGEEPGENKKKILRKKIIKKNTVREKVYWSMTNKLVEIIKSHNRKILKNTNLNSWQKEFKKLCEKGEVSDERVFKGLNWVDKTFGGEYSLVILCGKSFAEKFSRLEMKMMEKNGGSYINRGEEFEADNKKKNRRKLSR